MDKQQYFRKTDAAVFIVGVLLLGTVLAQYNPGRYELKSQAPISAVQRLEYAINQIPGVRAADARVLGDGAEIELWLAPAVGANESMIIGQRAERITYLWDGTLAHCKIKKHGTGQDTAFRPY